MTRTIAFATLLLSALLALPAFAIGDGVSVCDWTAGSCSGPGGGGSAETAFANLTTVNNSLAVTYNSSTWTAFTGGTSWGLRASSVNFTNVNGVLTYTGTATKTFQCMFVIDETTDSGTADVGEIVQVGLSVNAANPLSKSVVFFTLEASPAQSANTMGFFQFDLDPSDTLGLTFAGVSTGGDFLPRTMAIGCEDPGNAGAAGIDGADGDFATDGPTNTAILSGGAPPVNKSASGPLSALEISGGVITNKGAVGTVILTLPGSCTAGQNFSIIPYAAQVIRVEPNGDDLVNVTDITGDYIETDGTVDAKGSFFCNAAGEWLTSLSGPWVKE